jgi:hypothetical protein
MLKTILRYQLNLILIFNVLILLTGCESAYYGTMEKRPLHNLQKNTQRLRFPSKLSKKMPK